MTEEVYFEEILSNDPRLGRHIRHDERSKMYAFTGATTTPISVRHTRNISILDQGSLGSCTGNAGIGCLGTGILYPTLTGVVNDWSEQAAVKLYSDATLLDSDRSNYPPVDTGCDGLSIAKVLTKRGWISGYQHTFSFNSMLAALEKQPVITGVNWYSSFYTPDANGIVTVPKGATVEGGHEFVLDEIDATRQLIGASNSWGSGWGINGRFYIPFDVFKRLLSEQGDVTVFVVRTAPAPQPNPAPVVNPVVPTPSPPPTPVGNADEVLWAAVKDWLAVPKAGTNKKVADALNAWHLTK